MSHESAYLHTIEYRQSTAEGMIAELPAHDLGTENYWPDDGHTAAPESCTAVVNDDPPRQCRKAAIVELDIRATHTRQEASSRAPLCGAHFAVHRSGSPLLILAVAGRQR